MVEQVKAEYKTVDIVVNSAGANPQMVSLDTLEEWAWDTVFNVNLKVSARQQRSGQDVERAE